MRWILPLMALCKATATLASSMAPARWAVVLLGVGHSLAYAFPLCVMWSILLSVQTNATAFLKYVKACCVGQSSCELTCAETDCTCGGSKLHIPDPCVSARRQPLPCASLTSLHMLNIVAVQYSEESGCTSFMR